jgi:uncharacterized protein with HEPN domain
MRLEDKAFLYDIQQAAQHLQEFAKGKKLEDYSSDVLLRSAIERQFEIVGEALSQLAKSNLEVAAQISEYRRIISFRNILVHGYAKVDDRVVWNVLQEKLPTLQVEVEKLLLSAAD